MVDATDGKRVAALDGIRGLAVLSVFFFHALRVSPREALLTHGYLGVQVFFVLSGFLISGRLFALADDPGLAPGRRWASFAVRRAARIAPLYYATLAILALDRGHVLARLAAHAWPWLLTYTTNFARFIQGEHIAPPHFWSLCVEEQYYLLFPLLVLTRARRWLGAITLGLILGSVVAQLACPIGQASELPLMHFNSFGAGVLAALIARDGHVLGLAPRWFHAIGAVGWVASVVWLVWPSTPFGAPCLPTALSLGTASVVLGLHAGGLRALGAALAAGPLVACGRISYGLYIVHPFVLHALPAPLHQRQALGALVGLAVSILVAALSFRFFETPVLERARRMTRSWASRSPELPGSS